jgi:hypothetical protein
VTDWRPYTRAISATPTAEPGECNRPLHGRPNFLAAVRLWNRFTEDRAPFARIREQLAINGAERVADVIEFLGAAGTLTEQAFYATCVLWNRRDGKTEKDLERQRARAARSTR